MPLTHTRELFAKALKGKYALGAFNVNNMELLQAIIEACEEEKAPVMLQISKGARQYANPVYLKKLIEAAVSKARALPGRANGWSTRDAGLAPWCGPTARWPQALLSARSTRSARWCRGCPRAMAGPSGMSSAAGD